jgi:ubiquinone/menaquinone biosynthesis C-methylase UbiE
MGITAEERMASHVRASDSVLHVSVGQSRTCYALARIAGPGGKVTGVDADRDQVVQALQFQEEFADAAGFDNLRFHHGHATDLKTDLEKAERLLPAAGVDSLDRLLAFEARRRGVFSANPMIPDASIDTALADLSEGVDRVADVRLALDEIARVLRPEGRCVLICAASGLEPPLSEEALLRLVEAAGLNEARIEIRSVPSVQLSAVKPAERVYRVPSSGGCC